MNRVLSLGLSAIAILCVAGCGSGASRKEMSFENDQTGSTVLAPRPVLVESKGGMTPSLEQTAPLAINQANFPMSSPAPELSLSPPVTDPTSKDIQQALKNAGFYSGNIDGNLGPRSKKAILEFQEKNGLTADGKAGPKTWKRLAPYLHSSGDAAESDSEISN